MLWITKDANDGGVKTCGRRGREIKNRCKDTQAGAHKDENTQVGLASVHSCFTERQANTSTPVHRQKQPHETGKTLDGWSGKEQKMQRVV